MARDKTRPKRSPSRLKMIFYFYFVVWKNLCWAPWRCRPCLPWDFRNVVAKFRRGLGKNSVSISISIHQFFLLPTQAPNPPSSMEPGLSLVCLLILTFPAGALQSPAPPGTCWPCPSALPPMHLLADTAWASDSRGGLSLSCSLTPGVQVHKHIIHQTGMSMSPVTKLSDD